MHPAVCLVQCRKKKMERTICISTHILPSLNPIPDLESHFLSLALWILTIFKEKSLFDILDKLNAFFTTWHSLALNEFDNFRINNTQIKYL